MYYRIIISNDSSTRISISINQISNTSSTCISNIDNISNTSNTSSTCTGSIVRLTVAKEDRLLLSVRANTTAPSSTMLLQGATMLALSCRNVRRLSRSNIWYLGCLEFPAFAAGITW